MTDNRHTLPIIVLFVNQIWFEGRQLATDKLGSGFTIRILFCILFELMVGIVIWAKR